MKKKKSFPDQDSDMRIPPIPLKEPVPSDQFVYPDAMMGHQLPDETAAQPGDTDPDSQTQENEGTDSQGYEENIPDGQTGQEFNVSVFPVELDLSSHLDHNINRIAASDDPSDDDYIDTDSYTGKNIKKSRTNTLYEPRQKKQHWIKPIYVIISLVIIAVAILAVYLTFSSNFKEQYTSPMTLKDEEVSNPEFSFMYHYVLIENAINIFDKNTAEVLSSPGEDNFPTYREYFLDMAAREIQVTRLLYDDATSKGYKVTDTQMQRAQAYIDWLAGKAADYKVGLAVYIRGYYGTYVTEDLIRNVLTRKYFTEDYANGAKLDELKATDTQAEEAYKANQYQYDQVSYHVLRIIFDQTDASFKATAHLHAQEIIDGIGHDETKFESVAASFFTGEAKDKILQPNSTLISNVRYANVDNPEWRAWLFDAARLPGDCTIFDDVNGFPILLCFSARARQTEPLRDVRFFYINREDTTKGVAGIPDTEILPVAQTILDSVVNESSMQSLETTYADEIAADKMKAAHNSDTYKGVLANNLDTWIFDPVRVSGDKTMIETDTQIIIAYYVGASAYPEWFDRVNSFIRMNNYQAFLLEKETEYPYSLNQDGLQYIKDVP